jgi:hypothetical protein
MATVEALFASGRVVDIALALMLLEAAWLWVYRRMRGRAFPPADLAWNLAAGACLLLALRAALTQAGWPWVALFLSAALVAHVGDFRRRLAGR